MSRSPSDPNVFRIKPYQYIHTLNNNTLVTSIVCGPATYTRKEHEKVVSGPDQMVNIPPRHYVQILNPVVRGEDGTPTLDEDGNFKLSHGHEEIRFCLEREPLNGVQDSAIFDEPFPLYPGEKIVKKSSLTVVNEGEALHLTAIRDFELIEGKDSKVSKSAGEEWLFRGPATYIPRVEVAQGPLIKAETIGENCALRVRAKRNCVDCDGTARVAGEEWLVKSVGSYLPSVDEVKIGLVTAHVLTDTKAIRLFAKRGFKDAYGVSRKAGQSWLVTSKMTEVHIPDVSEEFDAEVHLTSLNNRQFCIVLDPIDKNGDNQIGKRELRKGEVSFFLNPGERLEGGVQNVHVLSQEEALLLSALERFQDGEEERLPGQKWMIPGPCDYIPTTQVEVIERRKVIPLDENEGIYVRDLKSGAVRTVMGVSTMLQPHEVLWRKPLPEAVEDLLQKQGDSRNYSGNAKRARDANRVVSYRAPHNSAVQIYDYKSKQARVTLGPDLVLLGADEEFTVLTLSGNTPKQEGAIKALCLLLGPDFMTDQVIVETSDHARLMLKLAYNWHFDFDRESAEERAKLFAVSDFVGGACKAIASRVRGAVAATTFDSFHRGSADIIRAAVFGVDKETGEPRAALRFAANNLVISNIDVQSVEPTDQRTREALQRSVQLAIEITTKSQEATARHESQCEAQIAGGKLQIQMIDDEAKAEKEKQALLRLRAHTDAIQTAGEANAAAKATADAADIQAQAAVEKARHASQAKNIQAQAAFNQLKKKNANELAEKRAVNELEITRARRMATIESKKFNDIVSAIGKDTIKAIAQAGPEMQAKLLQGLGLKSFMITDGNSPINLFNTANGLVGGGAPM